MKNKIPAVIAFYVLFFAIVGWMIYFLKQPSLSLPFFSQQQNERENIKSQPKNQTIWAEKMSNQERKSYAYPTNEMILKYNFDRGVEPLRVFIKDLSEYRFYCINQVLIENKIEYAYYKTNEVIQLVVFLNNQEIGHRILQDFNYYQIEYSVYEVEAKKQ